MADRTQLRRDIARSQQRRQYLEQLEQQRRQQAVRRTDGRDLPDKENQTRHNPVSERDPVDYGFDQ